MQMKFRKSINNENEKCHFSFVNDNLFWYESTNTSMSLSVMQKNLCYPEAFAPSEIKPAVIIYKSRLIPFLQRSTHGDAQLLKL